MTEDGTIIPADFEPAVKKLTAEEYEDQIKVLYEAFTSAQSDLEDAVATIEVLEKEIIEREIEKRPKKHSSLKKKSEFVNLNSVLSKRQRRLNTLNLNWKRWKRNIPEKRTV